MTTEQQIAAIRAALAAIETAMAQTESALRAAATPADVLALTSTLADLRAERARLQFQLANLEAARVVVAPLAVAAPGVGAAAGRAAARVPVSEVKALEKWLKGAVTDRTVVSATLDFAVSVARMAKSVRMIGDDPTSPRLKPKMVGDNPTRPKIKKPGRQ